MLGTACIRILMILGCTCISVLNLQPEDLPITDYITCIQNGMGKNHLKMNMEKTLLIWIGTRFQLAKVTVSELQPVIFYLMK